MAEPGGSSKLGARIEVAVFGAVGLVGMLLLALFGYSRYLHRTGNLALPATLHAQVASSQAVIVPADFGKNTLSIPAQAVTAPISAQHVDSRGYLGIPADVHDVGYYTGGGPLDGRTGDLVVAGHVNYVGQGAGALGRIGSLKIGDALITRGSTVPQGWRVTGLTSYLKSDGLPASMFSATGRRELTLVTCGGTLDRRAGSYLSNVVVIAVPVRTIVR